MSTRWKADPGGPVLLIRKKLIKRVLPGTWLVLTSCLRWTSMFNRDDLPTLERPATAIWGMLSAGNSGGPEAEVTNSAEWICIGGLAHFDAAFEGALHG